MRYTIISLRVFLFLIFSYGIAAAKTWTGTVNSDWNNAGNWNPSSIPTSTDELFIPGTSVINWPMLTEDVLVGGLDMKPGSQIDTRGYRITVSANNIIFPCKLTIQGAQINNTKPGTEIVFYTNEADVDISNNTFSGNSTLSFSGVSINRYSSNHISIGSNHFIGNTKIIESGGVSVYVQNTLDYNGNILHGGLIFDGDLDIERTISGSSYLFENGATINGNFKYKNLPGTRSSSFYPVIFGAAYIGSQYNQTAQTNVSGNIDISHNGDLMLSKNLNISGNGTISMIGNLNAQISYEDTKPFKFSNLTIDKTEGANVTLTQQLSLKGTLSLLNGNITTTQSAPLTLLSGSSVVGGSNASHVVGPMRKTGNVAFVFPVGSGQHLFTVGINAPDNVSDQFSAEYIPIKPSTYGYNTDSKEQSLSTLYKDGYWQIGRIAGSSAVAVSLGYNMMSGSVTNQSNLRVAHWNGALWEDLGNGATSGSLTAGSVTTASEVNSFSPFTIGSADASNPLPVRLIKFLAQKENQSVVLHWTTTEEVNSSLFEIQVSQNASMWQHLGSVQAKGQSNAQENYTFNHSTPFRGLNYYRLKMIDTDGSFAYSKIQAIENKFESGTIVYPNPVTAKLSIQTPAGFDVMKLDLHNNKGEKIMSSAGNNSYYGLDLSGISFGTYYLTVTLSDKSQEVHKILVGQ